jgi:TDG/mug DNA glycosylase family protein
MKNLKAGFRPVDDIHAKILILGSMPGEESLRKNEYYANTQNSFWKIMAALLKFGQDASYEEKTNILKKNGVALWDVMRSCERQGSLDSAIRDESIVENNFVSFYLLHPEIKSVFFNGAKAEREYSRRVLPVLPIEARDIEYHRLPSTSAAMARLLFDEKLLEWTKIRGKHNHGVHDRQ